jgi:hypothetical protein
MKKRQLLLTLAIIACFTVLPFLLGAIMGYIFY